MKALLVAAAVCGLMSIAADETKLGEGVSLKEATPIAKLTADPAAFVGKTIRVDGVATAVCEEMGCWMAVADENDPNGKTVRLKVEDGVIVFPVTAKGKKVSAQGVFEAIGGQAPHEASHEAARPAVHDASHGPAGQHAHGSTSYQIRATGALIK